MDRPCCMAHQVNNLGNGFGPEKSAFTDYFGFIHPHMRVILETPEYIRQWDQLGVAQVVATWMNHDLVDGVLYVWCIND